MIELLIIGALVLLFTWPHAKASQAIAHEFDEEEQGRGSAIGCIIVGAAGLGAIIWIIVGIFVFALFAKGAFPM